MSVRENLATTPLRVGIGWGGVDFVVACDPLRPINSSALTRLGELGPADSLKILKTFQLLLVGEE